jgi:hypothetical protein
MTSLPEEEEFCKMILAEATEDILGLWEPLWTTRSMFASEDNEQQIELAKRCVRRLALEGLIVFIVRRPPEEAPGTFGPEVGELSPTEGIAELDDEWWTSLPVTGRPDGSTVWFEATEKGRELILRPSG